MRERRKGGKDKGKDKGSGVKLSKKRGQNYLCLPKLPIIVLTPFSLKIQWKRGLDFEALGDLDLPSAQLGPSAAFYRWREESHLEQIA